MARKTIKRRARHTTIREAVAARIKGAPPGALHTTQHLSSTLQIPVESVFEWLSGANAALLDITCPGQNPLRIPLSAQAVTIGRDRQCRVCLPLPSVSRRHARINLAGEEYRLLDLESTNGTFVNGVRISRCILRNNDQIRIGQARMVFVQQKMRDAE
jgi:hypothetical protein